MNDETAVISCPTEGSWPRRGSRCPGYYFGDNRGNTLIATSPPPFTTWTYNHSTVTRLDGPALFAYNGRVYAVGRYQPGCKSTPFETGSILARKRTSLFLVEEDRLVWLSDLPSAGDTSYAGVVVQGRRGVYLVLHEQRKARLPLDHRDALGIRHHDGKDRPQEARGPGDRHGGPLDKRYGDARPGAPVFFVACSLPTAQTRLVYPGSSHSNSVSSDPVQVLDCFPYILFGRIRVDRAHPKHRPAREHRRAQEGKTVVDQPLHHRPVQLGQPRSGVHALRRRPKGHDAQLGRRHDLPVGGPGYDPLGGLGVFNARRRRPPGRRSSPNILRVIHNFSARKPRVSWMP